jgi:hypothetical protein
MPPRSRKKATPAVVPADEPAAAPDVAEEPVTAEAPAPAPANPQPHVILQLPIPAARVDEILQGGASSMDLPTPYVSSNEWTMSCTETGHPGSGDEAPVPANCFWCCHPIPAAKFGMPIDYDAAHRMFTVYGHFCSVQCVAAHNMATHMGSDRMWDIHGWIQMMAKMHGLSVPVRPAPSRYVLKMFGGPMDIDEFRGVHRTASRTVVLNVPPLVNVRAQVEAVNTSFLGTRNLEPDPDAKGKLARKKSVADRSTLEVKMNLSYTQPQAT